MPGAGNPQAFNRYAYALGNPMLFIDPSGHRPCDDEWDCEHMPFKSRIINQREYNKSPNTLEKSEDGRLYGPPGGPKENKPDLPMEEYNPVEAQAQAVVLAIDIFADFTYNVYPNFQTPSWYGNSFYEPLDMLNSKWSIPGIQPAPSDLWWLVKGVQVNNKSNEVIYIFSINTSRGGDKFDYMTSTMVYPFEQAVYTAPDINRVLPRSYSNVFSINQDNIIRPGESYFIHISVISELKKRWLHRHPNPIKKKGC